MDYTAVDVVGFILWVLIFPVYHAIYPWLGPLLRIPTARDRVATFRRSWIEWIVKERQVLAAAQQTRNLTMVTSLLASSALIMLGFVVNIIFRLHDREEATEFHADHAQLYLLVVVLTIAFSYFINALRHIGQFNFTIGADPKLVDEVTGSSVDYFTEMIARASNRYTLGVRTFHSVLPLLLWVFSDWLFLLLTLLWGIKFIFFQDFRRFARRRDS